ncbi:MAG: chemotaxis protein CheW [Vicinamibacteraceae bacterium]
MTPSHHGLGSVVLCMVGTHTVAVDMRHVAGTGRLGRDRDDVVDLAPGLGLPAKAFERVLHLQTPAGRVSLGVEKVSQPLDTTERIPLSPLAGGETARHFEAMAQVNGEWYLVLDVRPFTGGSAHAAQPIQSEATAPVEDTPTGRARTRLARRAALGHLVVFSAETAQRDAHPLAYALSAAQVVEVTLVPEIVPIPLAPPHVRGLCEWRNRPLVVVDLPARLMTDQRQTTHPERLIICRRGSSRDLFGVLAAADIQMVRLPIAHAPTVREFPLDRRCTRTVVDVGETTLVLPDLARLSESIAARV